MVKPIDLAGFDAKFRADADPWRTFTDIDEAAKRRAILHALGAGCRGRVWEPACGAGANSVALAGRALRLDASDGSPAAVARAATALGDRPHARATRLALPARPPLPVYDAVVVAEVLYYLSPRDMGRFAGDVARALRRGGRLVLAHHRRDFYDFAQHAAGVHDRFLQATGVSWRRRGTVRGPWWSVEGYDRLG